ncbi:MAG: glycosyltransferase [Anaerolineae bacterium]
MKPERVPPSLSVIVASYNARSTIAACLRSLEAQRTPVPLEVIVVDSSSDGTDTLVAEDFPGCSLLHFDERKYCGDARNLALEHARGNVVAFVDADCTVPAEWADLVMAAHRGPDPAIGGAIANGNPQSLVGWAAYLCEFSQWMPGMPAGPVGDIAGASMTYKRTILAQYKPFIEGTYGSDTELHWRLARAGVRIRYEPSIVVYHHNITKLRLVLAHEFRHGRDFARVRSRKQTFTPLRRALYAAFSPAIAVLLMAKTLGRLVRVRHMVRPPLRSLPIMALGFLAWSLGEAEGYSRG